MKSAIALAVTCGMTAPAARRFRRGSHAKRYQNCTQLNKVYKHGVGKKGARDKTNGRRVTNFTVNNRVYELNKKSDRDKDGIACEKL